MRKLALPGIVLALTIFAGASSASGTGTPSNRNAPSIHGSAREGNVLDAHHGRWDDSGLAYGYQWRRCLANGTACGDITGATDRIYAPRAEDVGRSLRVVVSATNRERRTGFAISDQTAAIAALPGQAPHSTTPPSLAVGGSALVASAGTWTGAAPIAISYRWRRCAANGGACEDTPAQSQAYRIGGADANHRLRVLVVATNAAGTSAALSDASPLVLRPAAPAKPQASSAPTVSGTPQQGQTLRGAPGVWQNKPSSFAYTWLRCDRGGGSCGRIGGAHRDTYVLGAADVGRTIRLQVEARNQGGTAVAVSAQSAPVAAPPARTSAKPSNTTPPKIAGTAQEGKPLTGDRGAWSNSPTSYEYTWRRCDSSGHNCDSIGGAHGTTYTPTAGDIGHTLRFQVDARNGDGSADATSAPTALVRAATRPTSTSEPMVSGTPQEGRQLAGSRGSWAHTPTAFAYAWLRCDRIGARCATIGGATGTTYVLTSADVGSSIVFRVIGSNSEGSDTAASDPTAVIQRAAAPTPSRGAGCPAGGNPDQVGNLKAPARLLLDGLASDPPVVSRNTATLVLRFHVSSTCGGPVQGALVYATATPFNQFTIPAEQPTGADGWATLVFDRMTGFPASPHQQLLALFARARKPGESEFGGIAARRLFSVHVRLR